MPRLCRTFARMQHVASARSQQPTDSKQPSSCRRAIFSPRRGIAQKEMQVTMQSAAGPAASNPRSAIERLPHLPRRVDGTGPTASATTAPGPKLRNADCGSPNVEAGAARGHYGEPKLINPEKAVKSRLKRRMQVGETQPPSSRGCRAASASLLATGRLQAGSPDPAPRLFPEVASFLSPGRPPGEGTGPASSAPTRKPTKISPRRG
jgi:hypothetical protein